MISEQVKLRSVAKLRAVETLSQKTQPNPRQYVPRLGYNTVSCVYTQGCEIGRFSGSTFNRLQTKKRKDERQKYFEEVEKKAKSLCPGTYEYDFYQETLRNLLSVKAAEQIHRSKVFKLERKRRDPVHVLSQRSKGKIRDKATAFFRCLKGSGTFATLTFVGSIKDRRATSILNKFLTVLRKEFPKLEYLRIAERQENGNIHFHIILNVSINIRRFNALWVIQQYNSRLYKKGISKKDVLKLYDENKIHKVFNPLDVEKIKTIYGLSYYLTKYITKNNSGFDCAAWHCSRGVSKLFIRTVVNRSCLKEADSEINCRIDKRGNKISCRYKHGAFYSLYYIENKLHFLSEMSEIEQINSWILEGMIPDKIPELDDIDIGKFYLN